MGFDLFQLIDLPRWNRKILTGFWLIIALAIFSTCIYDVIAWFSNSLPIEPIITLNTIWLCIGLLVIEAVHKWTPRGKDYIVICGAAFVASGLIYSFPDLNSLLTVLFLPILISIFYFQTSKVVFSYLLSLVCFYVLYVVLDQQTTTWIISDVIAVTGVLLVGLAVALGIMSRGKELLKHLQSSLESGQDLLVRNVIMDKLAKTDALTDLYNHMSFHEYLDKLIDQGERYNFAFQLALLDIDHFKKVNDSFGHRAGDAVLKKVAQTIKSMVSLNDFPARYGGEEFAIIFTDMDLQEATLNLENIRKHIATQPHEELNGQAVTISIGVYDFQKGITKEMLFKGTDEALYEAKRSGRNQTIIYTG
ncbi:diguanylate cyclase (GGDEF) domain-containing protein [Paenibacillus sp. 1_12]|uniref:GGDEF domain-containing protein n=1 Tax=Paenibacillus sp. 1_12 TaxID=1566278 RepID=UPI0008E87EAF|nr:GGDEF domain-containing protein [Paenibacillus sp. 1_12]SFL14312.1 diguanylate cyclase (GGDEF) domain-containing protein [Paenibacillus sp. 1_12]